MPKPLKPLLIIFAILVFAGIFALSWNQWLRPAGDTLADGASSGTGQVSQSAESGSGQATTAQSEPTGEAPGQSAGLAATDQSGPAAGTAEDQTASSATGDRPVPAAPEGGADGTAAGGDEVAALTPDAGTGSAQSVVPAGEAGAVPDAPDLADAPAAAAQPSFDIVRVEPSGDTVVAGRSTPDAKVELLSNGSVIAKTTANAAGEFVLVLETPLAAGGHDLALRTSGGEGVSIYSKNSVAVAVPEKPSGEVLVVMNEPGAASEILTKPDEPAGTGGETVIATAPSAETLSGETQIAAAPEAPATEAMPAAQPQAAAQPQIAEPVVIAEPQNAPQTAESVPAEPPAGPQAQPQTAETAPMAPAAIEPEPRPQIAEITPAAPVVAEPPAQTADLTPAVPVAPEPQPLVAEIAPAAPQPQTAESAPAAPVAPEPQPQVAGTAAGEKPAGDAAGQVADAGQAAAEVALAPPVPLSVEAVEVEGGKLYAAGRAQQGATIRVYVDDKPIGETTAFDNGRWLVETAAKVPAGTVIVRADQIAPRTSDVVARAEVPFTRQLDMAVLVPTASGGAPAGAAAQGELPKLNAVIIRRGDSLWTISRRTYGLGVRYTTIYTANKDQIRNPNLIYPGQVFMLPVGEKSWTQ